ncbi:ATP-grasp peptide maturase system methyltransferase [Streptomyces sp. NPDC002659]|uniref:ATP-grasp peptide maturase system methyltransferase n=1 Tax=Streptomyces sp. NPDC002659 TaxID=3364656 RepID=UPI0036CDDE0A
MTTTAATLRCELAATLAERGHLTDPTWRAAVESTPRELFLGPSFYRPSGTQWEPVHRDRLGVDAWLRLVYSDTTWVTQVDGIDAAEAPGPLAGRPTSSSTLPSLVVRMLELAGLRDGDKVLEIGTGTGYSTVILCHRLGEKLVFSVEYDPGLAALAAHRIHDAGFSPTLVNGDGLQGHKEGADYDAIVATCSVRSIPRSWLWQLRDGGTITTTISGWMLASGLIRLTMGEDGTATGRFTGDTIGYMLARPHERPPRPQLDLHLGTTRATLVDPTLIENWTGHFLAQLAAPSAELLSIGDSVILVDVATGSQAWTEPAGGSGWTVHQHGALRLWDQVEVALATWQEAGAPDQSAFGMTVTDDAQTVWMGEPSGPSWQLPI